MRDVISSLYIIVHSLGSSKKSTVQEGMRACTQCPLGEPLAVKGSEVSEDVKHPYHPTSFQDYDLKISRGLAIIAG